MNQTEKLLKIRKQRLHFLSGPAFRAVLTIVLCALLLLSIPPQSAAAKQAGNELSAGQAEKAIDEGKTEKVFAGQAEDPLPAAGEALPKEARAEKLSLPVRIGCAALLSLLVGLPVSYVLVKSLTKPKRLRTEDLRSTRFASISLPTVTTEKIDDTDVFVPNFDNLNQP